MASFCWADSVRGAALCSDGGAVTPGFDRRPESNKIRKALPLERSFVLTRGPDGLDKPVRTSFETFETVSSSPSAQLL
jgi:hypothetical protein